MSVKVILFLRLLKKKSSKMYTNFSGQWDKIILLLFRICLIVWNCIYKNTDTENINKLNLKRQTKHFFKIIFNTSTTYHIQDRKDIFTQAWSKTERKVGKISLKTFKVLIFSNHYFIQTVIPPSYSPTLLASLLRSCVYKKNCYSNVAECQNMKLNNYQIIYFKYLSLHTKCSRTLIIQSIDQLNVYIILFKFYV